MYKNLLTENENLKRKYETLKIKYEELIKDNLETIEEAPIEIKETIEDIDEIIDKVEVIYNIEHLDLDTIEPEPEPEIIHDINILPPQNPVLKHKCRCYLKLGKSCILCKNKK